MEDGSKWAREEMGDDDFADWGMQKMIQPVGKPPEVSFGMLEFVVWKLKLRLIDGQVQD